MYSTTPCATAPACDGTLERPRYFARQLVTPTELNLEAEYFLDRLRRHNRMLHGWGTVCGTQVCRVPTADGSGAEPWKVKIKPGYLIDGYGNEIAIDAERVVDLRSTSVTVPCGAPAGEVSDPWCSDVMIDRQGGTVWVAVCHKECLVRPVRTQPTGCGCDDTSCEYSRYQDGYEVRLLDACPPAPQWTTELKPGQPIQELIAGPLADWLPCPDDPCVVLAAVEVDASGTVAAIDNCSCRRMVISFARVWWRCTGGGMTIDNVTPFAEGQGAGPYTPGTTVSVTVTGTGLRDDATVSLGPGVGVSGVTVNADGALQFNGAIDTNATPGDRALTITNPDCSMASKPKALTVSTSR